MSEKRHSTLQVTRCTVCQASVMYLWLQLQPKRGWHCEMRACEHADEATLTRWRYTKRHSRPGLHLALEDIGPSVHRPTAPGFPNVDAAPTRSGGARARRPQRLHGG
jgi:hypothetical protein